MFLQFDFSHLQNFIQLSPLFLQEELSHDPLVHKQVFSKEWTSGEERDCHKGIYENVDAEDRFQPRDVGSSISSPK